MAELAEQPAVDALAVDAPLFDGERQQIFDKALSKRIAAMRRKYEAIIEPMHRDLMDTVGLLEQVFERCTDRLSPEDGAAILDGMAAIRKEHGEKKWQKR